ncbi:MAG TPA: hemolysin family protein [Verrucomicrobiae bacterium]|nr:hemolysin family protein [Verrucomicrobiae bacterium]
MQNAANLLTILWEVLLVLGLVSVNGFFVAAEFALARIRETQLDMLVIKGNRRAKVARSIIANLNSYLSATQLGITMASLGLGWAGEPVFLALLSPVLVWLRVESPAVRHSIAFAVGFTALTFLHISAGELAPKWLAIQYPLPLTLRIALPLRVFYLASYPLNRLLNLTAQWILRQAGIVIVGETKRVQSEEELRLLVSSFQGRAGGGDLGRDIFLNALDLRRRLACEVMRPRQEIVCLDTEASIAQCLDVAEKTRYSRFPLCEGGDLDKTLGVIHIKDLFTMRFKVRSGADLLPVARKLIYVPEVGHLEKLLRLFLERKLHLGIVVDEYGGTVGMITLENILEELVGQIQDEFDQEKPLLVRVSDSIWDAAGALPLHELEELVGAPLAQEGITTVSGWVTHRLGGFPKPGDVLKAGSYDLQVKETDGMRVARLRVSKRPEP